MPAALQIQGRRSQAEQMLRGAIESLELTLGKQHHEVWLLPALGQLGHPPTTQLMLSLGPDSHGLPLALQGFLGLLDFNPEDSHGLLPLPLHRWLH